MKVLDPNNLRTFLKWNNKSIGRCSKQELVDCVIYLTRQLALYKEQESQSAKSFKPQVEELEKALKVIEERTEDGTHAGDRVEQLITSEGVQLQPSDNGPDVKHSFLPYPIGSHTDHHIQ